MIRRAIAALSSLRFTLVLILSLSLVFLLGLWIPQKGLLRQELYQKWKADAPGLVGALDAIGFTEIYTSPVTLTLWALFFLNLALVMWQRVPVVLKKIDIPDARLIDPAQAAGYPCREAVPLADGQTGDKLQGILKRLGFLMYGTPARFSAVKHRFSPVATILFHVSFFLMLVGGVVTVYTRFSATVDLAEGEHFTARLEQYAPGARIPRIGDLPDVGFTVEKITPHRERNTPTALTVDIREPGGTRRTIGINRPYKADYTSFVIQDLGVAPLVIIQGQNGQVLDGAYVKLNVLQGRQDSFSLQGMEFVVDFFPDYVMTDGKETTRSNEIVNPAFHFYVQKDRRFIAGKTIRPGESLSAGEYEIVLQEMRYWVRFYVVRERGLAILYAGFSLATAALIWRLLFYRRELVGSITNEGGRTVLLLAGRAEFYRALFEDEFTRVVEAVKGQ